MPSAHPQFSSRRRERRALPRSAKTNPLVGLVNSMILAIGLTVILASRCDQPSSPQQDQQGWLDHLVIPKDLHLPTSVTDKLIEGHVIESSKKHKSK
jgi:hypothetical protein